MFVIINSNEYKDLKEKVEKIKNEVADLIQEKYDLTCYVIPTLLTTFTETLGSRKRRILAQELMVEELKYRIKLAQAAKNRQGTIKVSFVDAKVKQEYEEYEKKQKEQFKHEEHEQEQRNEQNATREDNQRKYEERHSSEKTDHEKNCTDGIGANQTKDYTFRDNDAQEGSASTQSTHSAYEFEGLSFKQKLKAIYKKLVKMLHPDVKHDFSEKEKVIWNKVQQAYNDGDLEALEKIYNELNEITVEEIPNDEDGIKMLKDLLEKLIKQREELIVELDEIKGSFPYTEKDFLEDEQKVKEMCDHYDKIIVEYEQQIKELTDRYYELVNNN